MFFKIGVLKNFTNFTGKHLRWSLFLIKQVLSSEICETFKKVFYRTPQVAAPETKRFTGIPYNLKRAKIEI